MLVLLARLIRVWGALPAAALLLVTLGIGLWRYPALPATLVTRFGPDGAPVAWAATSVGVAFGPVLIGALLTLLRVAGVWLTGQTAQAIDVEEPDVSREALGRRARGFRRGLLWLAAWVNVALLLGALQIWGLAGSPAVSQGSTAALVVGVLGLVGLSVGARRGDAQSPGLARPQPDGPLNRDDDRFWIGGVFYWNPADPAIIVSRRFGLGWTFNHARPITWLVLLGIIAAVICSVILGRPLHLHTP